MITEKYKFNFHKKNFDKKKYNSVGIAKSGVSNKITTSFVETQRQVLLMHTQVHVYPTVDIWRYRQDSYYGTNDVPFYLLRTYKKLLLHDVRKNQVSTFNLVHSQMIFFHVYIVQDSSILNKNCNFISFAESYNHPASLVQ